VDGKCDILSGVNHATPLALREFHQSRSARFTTVNGLEAVADYGDALAEYTALRESAAVLDLCFRGRVCLVGADRVRFLHGQVTNDVKRLRAGEGCYAALVTAKGKMVCDLNIFCLQDELLLDFEPGLTQSVTERLEKYIVADDAQVVDVSPLYGLLSVQGPKAEEVVRALGLFAELPAKAFDSVKSSDATLGEIYLMNQPRLCSGSRRREEADEKDQPGPIRLLTSAATNSQFGFDLFVPTTALGAVADKLIAAARTAGGRAGGWTAFETARIEAGIPRFGADMDETNLPLECGLEARAVSYNKGCYIGQEVLNRVHSIGHVNRHLVGLRLADDLQTLPARGEKLFHAGKEVGHVTSAVASPALKANLALGYVRREANQRGNELTLRLAGRETRARLVALPFAV
jgi:folate-binding protein YgfZ